VQLACAKLLTAIYEQDFLDCSHGYRPGRSAKETVCDLSFALQFGTYGDLVEADIRGFFAHMDPAWLLKMLALRVDDGAFLRWIRKWLKAGVLERDGEVLPPGAGTPQGGIVSPVLSNIYLHHVLDLWFECVVKPRCRGEALLCRYADDGAPRRRIGGRSPPCSHAAQVMGVGPPKPPCRRRLQTTANG
jgi:RNA-directed DNA polymerase